MPRDNPADWKVEDLQSLISNKVEESLVLEYKASPALANTDGNIKAISKDVSSFANAAGGTIIYGIPESGGLPQPLDSLLNPADTSKEWLEQVIHSRIRPRLDVHINPVSLPNQRVAYVVGVPQGKTAHQASDFRYYKRSNTQCVPMLDHEIRDVMNRSRHPLVEPQFHFQEIGAQRTLYLQIVLRNVGAMRARDIKLVLAIPADLFRPKTPNFSSGKILLNDKIYDRFIFQKTDIIIFPEDEICITDNYGRFISTQRVPPLELYALPDDLRWRIYADDMPPREGRILLKEIPAR